MLDIRIRIKKRLTAKDLKIMSEIAEYVSKWVKEDENLENVFESGFTDLYDYHYRVNIGHNIITFYDITKQGGNKDAKINEDGSNRISR